MKTDNKISLSSLSLWEKASQMVIVKTNHYDSRVLRLGVGGIVISRKKKKPKEYYKEVIGNYKNGFKIRPLICAELEGVLNPFSDFYESRSAGELEYDEEAYDLGTEHGALLKQLGVDLNLAPFAVPDYKNPVWPGRSFGPKSKKFGRQRAIAEKMSQYVEALDKQGILSSAKYFPGGIETATSILRHIFTRWHLIPPRKSEVSSSDMDYFEHLIEKGVDSVMMGHQVAIGFLDSGGKQCSLSPEIVGYLKKKFSGLIVSDAILNKSLKRSYSFKTKKMYPDLIKAGNDIIVDSPILASKKLSNPREVEKRISFLVNEIKKGRISEKRIDESVGKILENKGFEVKS